MIKLENGKGGKRSITEANFNKKDFSFPFRKLNDACRAPKDLSDNCRTEPLELHERTRKGREKKSFSFSNLVKNEGGVVGNFSLVFRELEKHNFFRL